MELIGLPIPRALSSVTRWQDHFTNIWPFATMKISPLPGLNLAKVFPNTIQPSKK